MREDYVDPATAIADAIEQGLDVSSSASRQHYIDTGEFLPYEDDPEPRDYADEPDSRNEWEV